jgi:hypothetical protein
MRCMHPPPLSLLPVPEPKALEPESQEPGCTPLPRTPPAMIQRHKGQSLQSTTPSTLSGRRLWMSWRLRLLLLFSFVSTQAFPLIADSLVCVFQDFVPSCVVASAGCLVSGYLAVCSLVLAFFACLTTTWFVCVTFLLVIFLLVYGEKELAFAMSASQRLVSVLALGCLPMSFVSILALCRPPTPSVASSGLVCVYVPRRCTLLRYGPLPSRPVLATPEIRILTRGSFTQT